MINKSMIPYYGFMAEAEGILPHQMTAKFENTADRMVAIVTTKGKATADELSECCKTEGFDWRNLTREQQNELNGILHEKLEKIKNL